MVKASQFPLRTNVLGELGSGGSYYSLTLTSFRQIIITFFPILAPESPAITNKDTAWSALLPLAPALVLCTLFFSSTLFTESISLSKYPEGYKAYQERVAMFVPFLTPVWGLWLQLQGKKGKIDKMLFGEDWPQKKVD